ncbi:response regulator transcription factor [Microbacterium sp. NPDC089698]|uniref:helix-turn-helix transcriptional regulator n=1 Tax=Microbacterium sp. NPDC089698 TaxID=3364200 RepID=UPI00382ABECB
MRDIAGRATAAWLAGDADELIRLMATRSIELWFTVPPDDLARMISDLPPDRLRLSPEAALASRLLAPGVLQDPSGFSVGRRDDLPPHLRRWMALMEGWQARHSGDLETAFEVLRGMPEITETDPTLVDATRGVRSLILNQTALTAALSGRFREALALYQRTLCVQSATDLTFLLREAHLRSALIHGIYGTPDAAAAHLTEAQGLERSPSWVEPRLDAEQRFLEAFLREGEPERSFAEILQLTYGRMGEIWPLQLLALHRAGVLADRRVDSRERIEALRFAGLGAGSSGLPGSVPQSLLALDSLLSGNIPKAREESRTVTDLSWPSRVVLDLIRIASGATKTAIADLNAAAPQTAGLRQADRQRTMLLALAQHRSGNALAAAAAVERMSLLNLESGQHEVAVLRMLSPRLLGTLGDLVPGLRAPDAAAVRPGVLDDPRLTTHELDVLAGLARGETREQIASSLFRSVNTVKTHQRSLYRKLGVSSGREAVLRATELGYL